MKKIIIAIILFYSIQNAQAQGIKDFIKKAVSKDTTIKRNIGLSNTVIISGLKEALVIGTQRSTEKLSVVDGFFKDAAIKVLLPEEAKKVEANLRKIPGGTKMVDNAILSMNRAAEDAAKSATPIFINAIKNINFNDAMGILKGGDSSATKYLRNATLSALTEAFRPIIENSLAKVNATQHWNTLFTTYNKFSFNKINPDLSGYVTEKALSGIFYQVALEEQKIRKDPFARSTDILKKVFGNK